MATLKRVDDDEWTYYTELTIRDFFLNPSMEVLCVYRIYNHLNVSLRFPMVPVNELTYFIREPREILRADTFRERVLFGTVNDNVESYVLQIVQNVLAPIFVKIDTWPDSILALLTSRLINQPRGYLVPLRTLETSCNNASIKLQNSSSSFTSPLPPYSRQRKFN